MDKIDCSDITIIPNMDCHSWYFALFRNTSDFKIEINLPVIKSHSKSEKDFINRVVISLSHETIHVVNWFSHGKDGIHISRALDYPFPTKYNVSSVLSILKKEGYLGDVNW